MSEWKEKALHELVEVDPEQLPSSTDASFSFFYIDISSVSLGIIDFPASTILYKDAPSRARKILKDKDILMSTVRPNLKAFAQFHKKSKFKFVASTGFAVLRSKPNVEIGFIFHSLFSNSIEKQIEALVVGSNYPSINTSAVRNLKIGIPTFSTQQKIAHILTTCDCVIERTQSAISKYKAIKQGMLHDLFTRGLDSNGKLRPTFDAAPELYKSSELGMIPKEWEVRRLEEITEKIGSGVTPTGGSEVYQTFGVLFIRSQNVLIGNLSIEDAAFISSDIDEIMEGSRVRPYDVLLNITGASIGRCAYFPKELKSANVNQHVCIIRFKRTSKPLAIYASEFLNSNFGQSQIYKSIAGGNREGLNFQQIKSFSFPSISQLELEKISKIIDLQSAKINAEETLLQKYQSVKRGLMGDLLGGGKKGHYHRFNLI